MLLATSLIEVGVDVPNATIMLVENAEQFGLAQLHQLRGRIGRGVHDSYCILVAAAKSREARQRLKVLEETTDGFRIAEADLQLRGPGELLGFVVAYTDGVMEVRSVDDANSTVAGAGVRAGDRVLSINDQPIRNVRDWNAGGDGSTELKRGTIVWSATNKAPLLVRLFKSTWLNPTPETEITTIDYLSTVSESAPFLIAITAEP